MLRNVMTVLSGTLFAQLIGVLCLPVLARLYDPAEFGRYQLYLSSMGILLMVVALRYEVALLSSEKGKEFRTLLAVTIRLCFITAVVTALVIAVGGDFIARVIPGIDQILWILPISAFFGGVYQLATMLPIRHRDYRLAASSKVVHITGFISVAIAFSFSAFSGIGLVLGDLVGRIFASIQVFWQSPRDEVNIFQKLEWRDARQSLSDHSSFPLYVFPGTLLSAISAAMVPLAFARLFSLEVAGQYALVERLLFIPVGMIAVAVSQVFTGDLAQEIRSSPLTVHQKFRHLIKVLAVFGMIGGLLGWFFLPVVIPIILGSEWRLSGDMAGLAAPFAAVAFIVAPINMVLLITGYRKTQLAWEIMRFIAIVAMFLLLVAQAEITPQIVMIVYAGVGCATYLVLLFLADRALAETSKNAQTKGRTS